MQTPALINAVVQQTMVLIAHLATVGGIRAPLAQVANQVFLDLTQELQQQGVRKNVIADMFGMALRTYHRRIRSIAESRTDEGRNVWEAVLEYIRTEEPVGFAQIQQRFHGDDPVVVQGVLQDLTDSSIVYRSGRAANAVYRLANEADFVGIDEDARRRANEYLVWLTVYRCGPVSIDDLVATAHLDRGACLEALQNLAADGRVTERSAGEGPRYESPRLDVPVGSTMGWEAAVLDHFQAMVSAICVKLRQGTSRSAPDDSVGGGTYTLDVWPGHPMESEARATLARVRGMVSDLRERVDAHNASTTVPAAMDQVVFYMGQYVKAEHGDTKGVEEG